MLNKARAGDALRVVDDQVSVPTFTHDLAEKLQELAATERYGLYHVTNGGETSWHDFAAKIFELAGLRPSLTRISAAELNAAARRPAYSVMENRALREAGVAPARPWHAALEDYLGRKGYLSGRAQAVRS
jgi:dTDP-4-dehydrorhamnose reductase